MRARHFYRLILGALAGILLLFTVSCSRDDEMTLEEAEALKAENQQGLLAGTIRKPGGVEPFAIGTSGGEWHSSVISDPKTFNLVVADSDGDSSAIINALLPDYLADYDPYSREWKPGSASFEIEIDEENDTMDVIFTLRDDLYWSLYDSDEKIKVTSDDVVFWYDEIYGNEELQLTAYSGQFMTMKDGSQRHIDIEKIDDRSFVFRYPRIVANPLLTSNMTFGPRFIYEPALREGGVEGLKNILSIDTDVKKLPSAGAWFLTEYTPGVRLVYEKNEDYFLKDDEGNTLPYFEKSINKIVPNMNTNFLLFKNGERDGYSVRAEDLDDLVNTPDRDYSIYDGGASMGSNFITFNQNPDGISGPQLEWFTQKEFRQAMSRLTNRERMVRQIYRGLGTPALHHYAVANPYYDEEIRNVYSYDPEKALELLASIGMERDETGTMRDKNGNAVVFDIITNTENNLRIDAATIFADECGKVGIKVNVKPMDFQKMVEMLTTTYDWDCLLLSLGSGNYWPTGGSNVWPTTGNLHLWNPLQEEPATEWEARVDYLYNEGSYTPDPVEAKKIWDEFQSILLEELPLYYLVYQNSFYAIRNKWENVYYDNLMGLQSEYLYLKAAE